MGDFLCEKHDISAGLLDADRRRLGVPFSAVPADRRRRIYPVWLDFIDDCGGALPNFAGAAFCPAPAGAGGAAARRRAAAFRGAADLLFPQP